MTTTEPAAVMFHRLVDLELDPGHAVLYRTQRDAMRTLLERLMADEVAHPKRAIRTWLDRCDDWEAGRVPIGENLP